MSRKLNWGIRFAATALFAAMLFIASCDEGTVTAKGKMPDFQVSALEGGGSASTKSLKGQAYLIDFWATWCGPCRKLMPDIQAVYDAHRKDGLQVLGVTDEDSATVRAFQKRSGFSYPIYLDPQRELFGALKIDAIPTTVVVDRSGNIVYADVPADRKELEDAVLLALNKK